MLRRISPCRWCSSIAMVCPGKCWSLRAWRYVRDVWSWCKQMWVGIGSIGHTWMQRSQKCFPTSTNLWFCDSSCLWSSSKARAHAPYAGILHHSAQQPHCLFLAKSGRCGPLPGVLTISSAPCSNLGILSFALFDQISSAPRLSVTSLLLLSPC